LLRFGTDGVRGVAHREITPSAVQFFARAAARALRCSRVVVGHDPRESSPELARAVAEGFRIEGVAVDFVGMAPTPAVAFLAQHHGCAAAVVTASHNPYTDNGLKFFRDGGTKLNDDEERAIQTLYEAFVAADETFVEPAHNEAIIGLDAYVDHVCSAATSVRAGMRIVVDCANGAMSSVAPKVLARLGLDVTVFNASPDGTNINVSCGAAHPEHVAELARDNACDIAVAFDGDGDRLIAATSDGAVVDGDHLIALAALDMKSRGLLANDAVVVTVMSNIGFHRAMSDAGITVHTTAVGDRSVLVELDRSGAVLGGEQSGHIIHRSRATTGDGLLAAVELVDMLGRRDEPFAQLAASAMTSFPQVLVNVKVEGDAQAATTVCAGVVRDVEEELGDGGRVLVRPSGTEPLVRVMVEARDDGTARRLAERIADAVRAAQG
jgi:phosphoglucosamine mutase